MRCVMGESWQLAIIYLTIQVAVYGLILFLPTQVAALLGTKVGFTASVVTAIPWVAALFGTALFRAIPDKTGERRNVAALNHYWQQGIWYWSVHCFFQVMAMIAVCCSHQVVLPCSRCSDDANATCFQVRRWLRGLVL